MIKAVIFDCFGVLIHAGFHETYRLAGGDPVKDTGFINDVLGQANLGLISSDNMRKQMIARIGTTKDEWQKVIDNTQYPSLDMMAYAAKLKEHYKLAILSNANIGTLQRKFTKEDLELFDTVVVSAEVGMMKPDPKIYLLTADNLGLKPDECLFIDDSAEYCEAAKAVGMQAVHFQSFNQLQTDLSTKLNHS